MKVTVYNEAVLTTKVVYSLTKRLFLFYFALLPVLSIANLSPWDPTSIGVQFVENKGQWADEILYKTKLPAGELFLSRDRLAYRFYDKRDLGAFLASRHPGMDAHRPEVLKNHVLHVEFVNANPGLWTKGDLPTSGKRNFLFGDDPSGWVTGVEAFERVTYKGMYEQIDMRVAESRGSIKYEYIVHPGGKVADIALDFRGHEKIELRGGNLLVRTSVNQMVEYAPIAFQWINGEKVDVPVKFKLKGSRVSYVLPEGYLKSQTLVIDPELVFSTSSGSLADNWGNTACVDLEGNLYAGGTVFWHNGSDFPMSASSGFPATPGAFQSSFNGPESVFSNFQTDMGILKFDSAGSNLLYATYIGGRYSDIPISTITNDQGELVILGVTSSSDFPGAVNSFNGGTIGTEPGTNQDFEFGSDIILTKLSADGSSIIGSIYVGGSGNDGLMLENNFLAHNYGDQFRGDVILGSDESIYVASMTSSSNFPAINSFDGFYGGGRIDGVVFRVSADLANVEWGAYIGGDREDAAFSIQLDSVENVYVAGGTTSSNFSVSANAYDNSYNGSADGWIYKISKDGQTLQASTFNGTSSFDQNYFLQLDRVGDVFVLGQTVGRYPVSLGQYSNESAPQFIHAFSPDLTTSRFSTVFGVDRPNGPNTSVDISPTAFMVNDCDHIFISGWGGTVGGSGYARSSTTGLPVTDNAFQRFTDGSDFYLAVFGKDMSEFLFGTFFGGPLSAEHVDGGTSRFDKRGIVYQSVCSGCGGFDDFPTYPDDADESNYPMRNKSFNCNNGVFKYDLANLRAGFSFPDSCYTDEVTFYNESLGGVDFTWNFGDGSDELVTTTSEDVTHRYESGGWYIVSLTVNDISTCSKADVVTDTVFISELRDPEIHYDTLCLGDSSLVVINDSASNYLYEWFPKEGVNDPFGPINLLQPDSSVAYGVRIEDSIGCVIRDSVVLTIPELTLDFSPELIGSCVPNQPPSVFIENNTIENILSGAKYIWNYGPEGSVGRDGEYQYKDYDTVTVYVTAEVAGCTWDSSFTFVLNPIAVPNIITPNGDDRNQEFIVEGIEGTGDWKFEVYNRWGKRVYRNDSYDNTWSGSHLPDGTYFYIVVAPDETYCKGWVQLTR